MRPGDWIKYRSSYYGRGRLAEVHAIDVDVRPGPHAVTTEGNVLLERILEIPLLVSSIAANLPPETSAALVRKSRLGKREPANLRRL